MPHFASLFKKFFPTGRIGYRPTAVINYPTQTPAPSAVSAVTAPPVIISSQLIALSHAIPIFIHITEIRAPHGVPPFASLIVVVDGRLFAPDHTMPFFIHITQVGASTGVSAVTGFCKVCCSLDIVPCYAFSVPVHKSQIRTPNDGATIAGFPVKLHSARKVEGHTFPRCILYTQIVAGT